MLDVAEAMHLMMDAEETSIGQTFSLPGPKVYTYSDLLNIAETRTLKKLNGLNTPRWLASAVTRLWEKVWWATISPDEVVRRFMDDKAPEPGTLGFADLGMTPDVLDDVAIIYLRRYRSRCVVIECCAEGSLTQGMLCSTVPTSTSQWRQEASSCEQKAIT